MKNMKLGSDKIKAKPLMVSHLPEIVSNLMHNLPGIAYRCYYDKDWTMLYLSEGCLGITGYNAGDILHNNIVSYGELIHPDDRIYVEDSIAKAVDKRVQFQIEYRIYNKLGNICWVWEQGNAIYDANNKPCYLDGYIADVTNRKKIEEELKNAAKTMAELNSTKDKFFSLIAHDLQNPVYAIITLSEFLRSNQPNLSPQEIIDLISQITASSKGIYTLLENLLDWARIQTGKVTIQKEHLSLQKLIARVLDILGSLAAEKNLLIRVDAVEDILVESDARGLTTILRNLISNAIKYSYKGSQIVIKLWKDEGVPKISVIDTGIGISRRNQMGLFSIVKDFRQPGTMKESGSGLGLVLTKDFVDILGMKLSVSSKLSLGSTFTLELSNAK
ncbi:MAG: PAS domain-containing sensor histidine kinase [Candidatus Cloacimonetes bacterium]|nr:PAS domain-containing sensor histidine kinase [Candidatus Cloacimonadota bacterium]